MLQCPWASITRIVVLQAEEGAGTLVIGSGRIGLGGFSRHGPAGLRYRRCSCDLRRPKRSTVLSRDCVLLPFGWRNFGTPQFGLAPERAFLRPMPARRRPRRRKHQRANLPELTSCLARPIAAAGDENGLPEIVMDVMRP